MHHLHHAHTCACPPPETSSKKFINKLAYFAAATAPLGTIPQLIDIWIKKQTAGVSPLSWIIFDIYSIVWLIYGVSHKEKPIVVSSILWLVFQTAVFVGVYIVQG